MKFFIIFFLIGASANGYAISKNSKFLRPSLFTCGTVKTLQNNFRGYSLVNLDHNSMVSNCIISERWNDQKHGPFNFSANPSSINISQLDPLLPKNISFFTIDTHDQERAMYVNNWQLVPENQYLAVVYSNNMASLCHPDVIPDTFYCYNTEWRNVTLCKNVSKIAGKLSFLFSFTDDHDWKIFGNATTAAQFPHQKPAATSTTSLLKYFDTEIFRNSTFGTDHFLEFNSSDPHPCVTFRSSASYIIFNSWLFCVVIPFWLEIYKN